MREATLRNHAVTLKKRVSLAKEGDKKAFTSLINENKLNLYRVAKAMLNSEADIEDAIQNTIIKAYENIEKLRNDALFKTWIIKILINQCNEIIRSNKKIVFIEDVKEHGGYYDSYKNIDLQKAIESLNEELRVVTVLFYYEDLPQEQIAKILEIPKGTVRSRLFRARERLAEILEIEKI